jgi:pimeloyl-ACP methyl ester carboxylesterase
MDKQPTNGKPSVLFIPGGVMPAEISYGPLLGALQGQIQPVVKDLEVYAPDSPLLSYGLELEVDGIRRAAEAAGLQRFHLVGYSAGGAACLAFCAKYPERLSSLALIEPAWIGSLSPADAADWTELGRLIRLPPDERMPAFMRWQMRPGVPPPAMQQPPLGPPPWMAKRPAGLEAISRAFDAYQLETERLHLMKQPVYYALGSLSTRFYERAAHRLAGWFPDMQIEEYEGRSHFDPPHRAEAQRFARALSGLWERAQAVTGIADPGYNYKGDPGYNRS